MALSVLTAGEGPAMLLLHGFTGTARSWSAQTEAWSRDHRVIAPDLLGHGGSDAPSDPASYALERQAADLVALLDLLEASPATVVGYSMGARLALALVVASPARVDRLVLESPSAGIADATARAERRAADERSAEQLERDGTEAFIDSWEVSPIFASHAALSVGARAELRRQRSSHDAGGLAASLRGAGQGAMTPLHDHLGGIRAPTLVVAGGLDAAGLERARIVAAGIPGARLEVIAGAGHTPHLETPQTFERLVSGFLPTSRAKH